jgi:hypothetical protein
MDFLITPERQRQIEQDNQRVLHKVLAPIRFFEFLMMCGFFVVASLYVSFMHHAGWVFNVGSRSQHAMYEQAAMLYEHPLKEILDVDFRYRSKAEQTGDATLAWFRPDHNPLAVTTGMEDTTGRFPFVTHAVAQSDPSQALPIDFCKLANKEARFDYSDPGYSERPETLSARKMARMQTAYEVAAFNIAALRSVITHLQLHQSIRGLTDPTADPVSKHHRPLENSYCNADGADPEQYSSAAIAAYRQQTYRVKLNDAPVVRFEVQYIRYLHIRNNAIATPDLYVVGMCLPEHCSDDDMQLQFGRYDAILRDTPTLTSGQEQAEKALLNTSSMSFWHKVAAENGVFDYEAISSAHDRTQDQLAVIIGRYIDHL